MRNLLSVSFVVSLLVLSSCAPASDNPLAELLSPENLEDAEVNGVNVTPGGDGASIVLRFSSATGCIPSWTFQSR
jgi:hypothetical protein